MTESKYKPLLWAGLAVVLVVFYTSFVTARTYYNPEATLVIVILGAVIAVSGAVQSRLPRIGGRNPLQNGLITKAISLYRVFFALALIALAADVAITSYAISLFGTQVEANKVVVGLVGSGDFLAWVGQQFAPLLIVGGAFALTRNLYVRSLTTFYTLGTLGYAMATVLNNLVVVYGLTKGT